MHEFHAWVGLAQSTDEDDDVEVAEAVRDLQARLDDAEFHDAHFGIKELNGSKSSTEGISSPQPGISIGVEPKAITRTGSCTRLPSGCPGPGGWSMSGTMRCRFLREPMDSGYVSWLGGDSLNS
jgi:hypothetical protein